MRRALPVLLGLFAASAGWSGWRVYDELAGPASVVLIILDNVRSDHTSLCGYARPTTPRLQALAASGASFTCGAVAPGSWTLPSHASFFTGVPVLDHGAHELPLAAGARAEVFVPTGTGVHALPLGDRLPTLAEEMTRRGLQARLVSMNPVLGAASGLTRGFAGPVQVAREFHGLDPEKATEVVLQSLDPDGGPLFFVLNLTQAHQPWADVPEGLGWAEPARGFGYAAGKPGDVWTSWYGGALSASDRAEFLGDLTDVYDAGIWRADAAMGEVLDLLETKGWCGRRCRVVITSDHGELLGEHGRIDHGFYVDEGNARVPVLVRGGGPLPSVMAGAEVFDVVRDGAVRPDPLPVLQPAWSHPQRFEASGGRAYGSVSAARWLPSGQKDVWMDGATFRYALDRDPGEAHPVPAALDAEMAAFVEAVRAVEVPTAGGSMAVEQMLEAAGYLEPAASR